MHKRQRPAPQKPQVLYDNDVVDAEFDIGQWVGNRLLAWTEKLAAKRGVTRVPSGRTCILVTMHDVRTAWPYLLQSLPKVLPHCIRVP